MMQNTAAQNVANPAGVANDQNPFGASTSAMFNDFEKAKTESNSASGGNPGAEGGQLPPGFKEEDLDNLEKQFMGMFQNISKQMENLDLDGDDSDDEDLTEEEKKEADAMLKNLFGSLGGNPGADGKMPDFSAMMGG